MKRCKVTPNLVIIGQIFREI